MNGPVTNLTHLLIALLALILTIPACAKLPSRPKWKPGVKLVLPPHPGKSACPLRPARTTQVKLLPPSPTTISVAGTELWYVPWKYPATTNYAWDVQASTNLTDWVTIFFNVGPDDITVTNTGQYRFFRMKGRP